MAITTLASAQNIGAGNRQQNGTGMGSALLIKIKTAFATIMSLALNSTGNFL
jgi:hypothetical protein